MKAIMVMFDSLNRHMLEPYGCDWVHTPSFRRLAERTVTFDTAYVGSMPCMPARRELHTGRYNFLHRSWGPLEPFDDSTPEILKSRDVYTHLVSDHYHYWEDGGCTYHSRYDSWDFSRGQEGDPWKANLTEDVEIPPSRNGRGRKWIRHDWMNRHYMKREEDTCQARTFAMGVDFLRTNHRQDNWFLHIETFDPHEPYFVPRKYIDMYPHEYDGPHFDWPPYAPVTEDPRTVHHLRCLSAALHSMCDEYLGKVLDLMDELDLWKDTMLIVNTDHGFLLGEHESWGKCWMPFYQEISHMPLFIWDPRSGRRGQRRTSLVQTIDLPATLLEYFGVERPNDMQGAALRATVDCDAPVRQAGLFGVHGAHVNCTDGRFVYMRAPVRPDNTPLHNHTLMPTHMRNPFSVKELQDLQLAEPFAFTKGCRTMKTPAGAWGDPHKFRTMLFDLAADPRQQNPIRDQAVEQRMIEHTVRLMKANDAPAEQYERLGLPQ
jgi:arylsulfatase A-like enzyme